MKPIQSIDINRGNAILMVVGMENEFCKQGDFVVQKFSMTHSMRQTLTSYCGG